jgi:DNA polymerase III delta prime subunit
VSISQGTLLVAIMGEFGPAIPRCVLLIDNTALLAALKERLEQASSGHIKIDLALAESVINVERRKSTVDAIIPTNAPLNIGQQKALHHLLQSSVAYLWGPPGTGKTETLSALVQSAFDAEKRVLICSNTNQAVDQVLLKLCNRLSIRHPAMIDGRILRLGQPINKELREKFTAYVTSKGILDRLSSDLKRRQGEVEDEIAHIDVEAAATNRVLGIFAELDRGAEMLIKLRHEADKAASDGKAAVAARDRAHQQRYAYQDDLRRRQVSGILRRTFMRSEEKIRADLSRAQAEVARRDEIVVQLKDAFDTARPRRDAQSAEVTRLAATVRDRDRARLEANRAAFEVRRGPLVSELQNIARKLADLEADILGGARVIGTTVAKSYLRAKDIGRFDLVIVDEASMVLLPALYFVAGLATERVIISGDFRQLPPIIPSRQQAIHDEIGKDAFAAAGVDEKPGACRADLYLQYRMAEPICDLITRPMYDGHLKTASDRQRPDGLRPPTLVD